MNERDEVREVMKRLRRGLPSSERVVEEAFQRLQYVDGFLPPVRILERFGALLHDVWVTTLEVLEDYERKGYSEGIPRELAHEHPNAVREAEAAALEKGFTAGVFCLFAKWYDLLRRCFLSISQSRKARGGKDFELQIGTLMRLADIPYERQATAERADLVIPDVASFERDRNKALVISVKRTLRGRWRQVAEELFSLRSPNVHLATADEAVSDEHVKHICGRYNIYLVVWDSLKKEKFAEEPQVLGYTQWAIGRLVDFSIKGR